jgi:succinylglutamate desuccinylase
MAAPDLTELDHLPAGLLERPASALHRYLGGPTLITLRGRRDRPLVVSVLQHGNEITGWEAVRRLLKNRCRPDELPRTLVLFIGNPLAAQHRVRRLDDQPDFNRCWPGGKGVDPDHARLFRRIHDRLLQLRPLACIDIHNNSGLNPHYAAVNRIRSDYLRLASLFSSKVVYFTMPGGTLSHSMAEFCPALTLECGQAGEIHGTDHSLAFLETCLHLEDVSLQPPDVDAVHLFHMVATVTVPADVLFGFGRVPADLALSENLDRLNFRELPAGTALGTLGNGVARPLVAVDTEGADVTDQYFRFDRGQVRTRREVMPSMLTLDHRIIRQDCLCYLMERIHFEDNEEVTGIDPLPDSLPRHD